MPSDSTNDDVTAILNAVASSSAQVWCYARYDSVMISHCSQLFLTFLGLELTVAQISEHGLFWDDVLLCDAMAHRGLDRKWLSGVLNMPPNSLADTILLPTAFKPFNTAIRFTLYRTNSGDLVPLGAMVIFSGPPHLTMTPDAAQRASVIANEIKTLSPRECEILDLVFKGETNKAAARSKRISEKTVEKHRANIMRKLHARTTAELIRKVTEARLIFPEPASDEQNPDIGSQHDCDS